MTYDDDMPESETLYCMEPEHVEAIVRRDVGRHALLNGVRRLGIAASGGADSTALFHLLLPLCREAGVDVTVLHFNHGLRQDADEDQRIVQSMADAADVPCMAGAEDVAARAAAGASLEMAARQARLAFLEACASAARLDAVATGHHAGDVAETLLLRLARGAGASGLAGLRPSSQLSPTLRLVRPLLSVAGPALRGWLCQRGLVWREDATNGDASIPRNHVRHTLLPLLEGTWQPHLRASLCQSAAALRDDDALLESLAAQALESVRTEVGLCLVRLHQQPVALQRRLLRLWLFEQGLAAAAGLSTVSALLRHGPEAEWQHPLPGGRLAAGRGGKLRIEPAQAAAPAEERELTAPGAVSWNGLTIEAELGTGVRSVASGIGRYPAECSLARRALGGLTLRVRSRRPGDRIAPTGLSGSKKLQDLFVDEKVPESARDHVPIVLCGDEVAWIPGHRIGRAFAVAGPDDPSVHLRIRPV